MITVVATVVDVMQMAAIDYLGVQKALELIV